MKARWVTLIRRGDQNRGEWMILSRQWFRWRAEEVRDYAESAGYEAQVERDSGQAFVWFKDVA